MEYVKYLIVDEFQDSNQTQIDFVKVFVEYGKKNLLLICDPDQNIYSFRGSKFGNIIKYLEDTEHKPIFLNYTYRLNENMKCISQYLLKKNP